MIDNQKLIDLIIDVQTTSYALGWRAAEIGPCMRDKIKDEQEAMDALCDALQINTPAGMSASRGRAERKEIKTALYIV